MTLEYGMVEGIAEEGLAVESIQATETSTQRRRVMPLVAIGVVGLVGVCCIVGYQMGRQSSLSIADPDAIGSKWVGSRGYSWCWGSWGTGCNDAAAPPPAAKAAALAPAPAIGGGGGGGGGSGPFKDDMLGRINQIRCMHDAPPMTWSRKLATQAQNWANSGSHAHSPDAFTKYGENMCWGFTVKKCVALWYDEIKVTNGGRLTSANYGASHYSQLVWRQTTEVGCGGEGGGTIVCQFKKRGNWAGACPDCYEDNVYGPTRSEASCPLQ